MTDPARREQWSVSTNVGANERRGWSLYAVVNAIAVAFAVWAITRPEGAPFFAPFMASSLRVAIQVGLLAVAVACSFALIRGVAALLVLAGRIPLVTLERVSNDTVHMRVQGLSGRRRAYSVRAGGAVTLTSRPSGFARSHGKRLDLEKPSVWGIGTSGRVVEVTTVWPIDLDLEDWLRDELAKNEVHVDVSTRRF